MDPDNLTDRPYAALTDDDLRKLEHEHGQYGDTYRQFLAVHDERLAVIRGEQQRRKRERECDILDCLTDEQRAALADVSIRALTEFATTALRGWTDNHLNSEIAYHDARLTLIRAERDRRNL